MIDNDTLLDIYKLKDVIRYNCRKHLKDESVAEHSFYVALMAMMICDEKKITDAKIIKDSIVKSLLHDMPEIELNDITYNVKEKMNLRPMLKSYEDAYYKKHFPKYAELMCDDSDNIVNTIMKLADTMSVKQFCLNEIEIGNRDRDIAEIYGESFTRTAKLELHLDELLSGHSMSSAIMKHSD